MRVQVVQVRGPRRLAITPPSYLVVERIGIDLGGNAVTFGAPLPSSTARS